MQREFKITIGLKGDEIVQRSGLKVQRSQVATALLYDASPDRTQVEATTVIEHGSTQLALPAAESVLFYDHAALSYGVEKVNVALRMPDAVRDVKDFEAVERCDRQVYDLVNELLRRINASGWRRFIPPSHPRIAGVATYPLPAEKGKSILSLPTGFAADSFHVLPFDQWRRLESAVVWEWYRDGAFLDLTYRKSSRSGSAPSCRDELDLNVMTERRAYQDPNLPPEENTPDKIAKIHTSEISGSVAKRISAEKELRALGIKVIEDWPDPPVLGVAVPRH